MNQILEGQVSEQVGADRYERTEERQGYRNGSRPRQLTTRIGQLTLPIPQVREGTFSTDLFLRYQRSEQALVLALLEMVVNGVSTRKVTRITEELCGTSVSKSTVSALCSRRDPLGAAWNEQPLGEQPFPCVIADALVLKIREGDRVRALSALLAIGVNAQGYRELLGLQIGDSESQGSWTAFFGWLTSPKPDAKFPWTLVKETVLCLPSWAIVLLARLLRQYGCSLAHQLVGAQLGLLEGHAAERMSPSAHNHEHAGASSVRQLAAGIDVPIIAREVSPSIRSGYQPDRISRQHATGHPSG